MSTVTFPAGGASPALIRAMIEKNRAALQRMGDPRPNDDEDVVRVRNRLQAELAGFQDALARATGQA